jgi:hypothetical protein
LILIVDSVTGKPYKGTSADKVASNSADVADFRDATTYLKFDKPNYLKGIPSGALSVYKNKTAFDKRNTTVNQTQGFQ